jgi:PKD repeat protein
MKMKTIKNSLIYLVVIVLFVFMIGTTSVSAISAHAKIQPTEGVSPLSVFFTDTSEGDPVDWKWDFGDGFTGEGPQIMHTYGQAGEYSITLTVTDPKGITDTVVMQNAILVKKNPFFNSMPSMQISKPSFLADFKGIPKTGSAPFRVTFTDLSLGNPTGWYWDFGDGTTDNVQNPVHIYKNPGVYTVTLKISKDSSVSSKQEKDYLTVTEGNGAIAYPSAEGKTEQFISSSQNTSSIVSAKPNTEIPEILAVPIITPSPVAISLPHYTPDFDEIFLDFYNNTQTMIEKTRINENTDMLSIVSEPPVIKAGEQFSIHITGSPEEVVYFWIIPPEGVNISEDIVIPHFTADQNAILTDNPSGPYPIGSYIPSDMTQNISLRDMVPKDPVTSGTLYYGKIGLDQQGKGEIYWTSEDSPTGTYFIRVESKESDMQNSTNMENSTKIRKAAASIQVQ